jgi:hypothetical protein
LSFPTKAPVPDSVPNRISDIHDRLSRVRGTLTDEEFDKLVADVIRTRERFLQIERAAHGTP